MKSTDEAKTYLESLAKKAGLADDVIKALVSNADVVNDAKDHLARQDELSSGLDRARNEGERIAREANARVQQVNEWYEKTGNPTYQEALKEKARLQKYRETFGELEVSSPADGTQPRAANGRFATKEDLDAMGLSAVQVSRELSFIASDYNSRFGPKFGYLTPEEWDNFEKLAVSKGVRPVQAYRDWIKPKEDQIAKEAAEAKDKEVEAKIKAAYDEGARSVRTSRQWDGETTRTTDHFGRDLEALKQTPEAADKAGEEAFLKGWNDWQEAHAGDLR